MKKYRGKFHRENITSRFMKDLVRRSRSKCELCQRAGTRLEAIEVTPLPDEPLLDHTLFCCESCIKQIHAPEKMNPHEWRQLHETVWSETPVIQVMSLRLLRRLSARNEVWATELLEQVIVSPEIEAWSLEDQ